MTIVVKLLVSVARLSCLILLFRWGHVYGASPVIVQISVNNPRFDVNSSETHKTIRAIQQTFPQVKILELQPGRAQKYFCQQSTGIIYPLIVKPDCDAKLILIDNIKMVVFYRPQSQLDVKYLGARLGYHKKTSDYAHLFPNIKQIFEVNNDQQLYSMFEMGRLDAIVMEEQSAIAFSLLDYPHFTYSEFTVYAAFRGVDPALLSTSRQ